METETTRDIREYVATLRRHNVQIVVVAGLLAAAAALVALGLPAVYSSSATILVQEQEVPPDLVRSTVTSFADERIQVISQQVMTRAQLLTMVEKYGLYQKFRDRETSDEIVARMRRDIQLSTIDSTISERGSGRRVNTTIAFKISYESPSPERAQQVVEELVSLYLSENAKVRQESAAETTAFLSEEANRLEQQIRDIESKLAEFKRRYAGRTPDSSAVNLQLAERTESELQRIEAEISMLQDRKLSLEAQLPFIKPNAPVAAGTTVDSNLDPEQRLRALQAQYASASAVYGSDHPDLRRMRREIAALQDQTGATTSEADVASTRRELEAQLATLRERYAEDHPDIQRLKRSIASLGSAEARAAPRQRRPQRSAAEPVQSPDNPAYIATTKQIESANREIARLAGLRNDLRAKQRTYDARLLQIPEIEREYRELTRDYESAQERYREVKGKQMQAEVAQQLEKDHKAERFTVLEPANLPQSPARPKRLQILLMGLVASLGGGVGLAFLRDAIDPSVKGPLELARIARVPVLTAIPYIETKGERNVVFRQIMLGGLLSLLIAGAYLTAVHQFIKPLPLLLESVLRRIGLG